MMNKKLFFIACVLVGQLPSLLAEPASFGLQSQQLTTTYTLLSEALNNAAEADTIVVTASGTMDEQVTIPDGVVLLVPFDEANTLYLDKPATKSETDLTRYIKPTRYCELTLSENASITIAEGGAVSVSAKQYIYPSRGQYATGAPQGPCGYIKLEKKSQINVQEGGRLYAWGFIYGEGTVFVDFDAWVYEMMQLKTWRGGVSEDIVEEPYLIFPFNAYFVQNIEAKVVYAEFAVEKLRMGLIADGMVHQEIAEFVGSDGLLDFEYGQMVRTYDPEKDCMLFTINGDLYIGSITVKEYSSRDYVMGLSSNFSFRVDSGELAMPFSMSLQPGSEIYIAKDALVSLGADDNRTHSFYVYDYEQTWKGKDYVFSADRVVPDYVASLDAAPAIPTIEDAKIVNNGTIEAYSTFYTTEGGANICSTDAGMVIFHQVAPDSVTYQVSGKKTTPEAIQVTSALLKNADGSYTATVDAEQESTFEYKDGKWINTAQTPLSVIDQSSSIHRKFIHDGQLYIRHKEHIYNAQGM